MLEIGSASWDGIQRQAGKEENGYWRVMYSHSHIKTTVSLGDLPFAKANQET